MELNTAQMDRLPQIEALFQAVNAQMEREGIAIWDDIYPAVAFPEDIRQKRLYVLTQGPELLGAFALCPWTLEGSGMGWAEPDEPACCLERLAVRVDRRGEGLGAAALEHAAKLAREQGARYLRLLVADFNAPAIGLYEKCGFQRVEGIYKLEIDGSLIMQEYGFERKL